VYSCYDVRNKDKPLCAKQIAKKEVDPILLKREIEILKLLRPLQQENENLVELVDVFEDKDKSYLYIIMEKCS
jgi:serine/threonine-protein kinase ULK/ATG1/calcium-dependent protein kinase